MGRCEKCGKPVTSGVVYHTQCAAALMVSEWLDPEVELPIDPDEVVLVLVSGKPADNITLVCAPELALYDPDEGWILEMWPEWESPEVHRWMLIPEFGRCDHGTD